MNPVYDAPRSKPYGELRGLLSKHNYRQEDIYKALGCSRSYFNLAINGQTPWRLDYCYQILDMFHEPHETLNKYFPKDGKQA